LKIFLGIAGVFLLSLKEVEIVFKRVVDKTICSLRSADSYKLDFKLDL